MKKSNVKRIKLSKEPILRAPKWVVVIRRIGRSETHKHVYTRKEARALVDALKPNHVGWIFKISYNFVEGWSVRRG